MEKRFNKKGVAPLIIIVVLILVVGVIWYTTSSDSDEEGLGTFFPGFFGGNGIGGVDDMAGVDTGICPAGKTLCRPKIPKKGDSIDCCPQGYECTIVNKKNVKCSPISKKQCKPGEKFKGCTFSNICCPAGSSSGKCDLGHGVCDYSESGCKTKTNPPIEEKCGYFCCNKATENCETAKIPVPIPFHRGKVVEFCSIKDKKSCLFPRTEFCTGFVHGTTKVPKNICCKPGKCNPSTTGPPHCKDEISKR